MSCRHEQLGYFEGLGSLLAFCLWEALGLLGGRGWGEGGGGWGGRGAGVGGEGGGGGEEKKEKRMGFKGHHLFFFLFLFLFAPPPPPPPPQPQCPVLLIPLLCLPHPYSSPIRKLLIANAFVHFMTLLIPLSSSY